MPRPLALTWSLSSVTGYGIYGVNIVLDAIARGCSDVVLTREGGALAVLPDEQAALDPIVARGNALAKRLADNPDEKLKFDFPVLHPVGNNFSGMIGQGRILGAPTIGCAAIEHKVCDGPARQIAGCYDKLIAISKWNETFLRELNVAPVHLCYQGIDARFFKPGRARDHWKNRFVVFSGGKFEFRKGQDLVVAAFKLFAEKHTEALLVTAWQNLLPQDEQAFLQAGHVASLPRVVGGNLDVASWLGAEGLAAGQFTALPYVVNRLMPDFLSQCDMAVFPNRCEGGTNLVAMEAMACGIPTFVSDNTGQKDLIALFGCEALRQQKTVKPSPAMASVEDWGESDVDEIVAMMERVYQNRADEKAQAEAVAIKLVAFDWRKVNQRFLDVALEG